MNIVFIGHTPFNESLVIGSHQLSRCFARQGHRVLHVSLPITAAHLPRLGKPLVATRFRKAFQGVRRLECGVHEWVPAAAIPWDVAKLAVRHLNVNPSVPLAWRIRRVLRRLAMSDVHVAFIDDPRMIGVERVLNAGHTIYRATDLYAAFRTDQCMSLAEQQLIRRVDDVFATSQPVADHLCALHEGTRVSVFPNGFDDQHFQGSVPPHDSLAAFERRRIVYVGAIDHRFDAESVVGVARTMSDVDVLLYGPVTTTFPAELPENLHLMGPVAYRELPSVLQHCDVALLPFRDIPSNHGRSPMKLFEYLAASPAVVSFEIDSLGSNENVADVFTYSEATVDSMLPAVRKALQQVGAQGAETRNAQLRRHSWTAISQAMLRQIGASCEARVSCVETPCVRDLTEVVEPV